MYKSWANSSPPHAVSRLIPQTKAAINSGKVFYHFSMMRKDTNAPSVNREHQICFFESHFVEMKYGWISGEQGTSNPNLQFSELTNTPPLPTPPISTYQLHIILLSE